MHIIYIRIFGDPLAVNTFRLKLCKESGGPRSQVTPAPGGRRLPQSSAAFSAWALKMPCCFLNITYMLHIWCIFLHLGDF